MPFILCTVGNYDAASSGSCRVNTFRQKEGGINPEEAVEPRTTCWSFDRPTCLVGTPRFGAGYDWTKQCHSTWPINNINSKKCSVHQIVNLSHWRPPRLQLYQPLSSPDWECYHESITSEESTPREPNNAHQLDKAILSLVNMRASGRFCGSYPSSPHARIGASGKCENDMPPSALSPLQTSQSCDGSRGTLSKLRQHVFAGNASLSPIPIPSNVQSVFQGLSTSKSPRLQKWEALTADVLEIQQKQLGASSRTSSKGNSTKDIMSSTGEERGVAFSGTFKLCSTVGRLYEHRESREFRSSLPVVLEEEEEAAERYASSGNLLALQASHQHTKTEDEEWI